MSKLSLWGLIVFFFFFNHIFVSFRWQFLFMCELSKMSFPPKIINNECYFWPGKKKAILKQVLYNSTGTEIKSRLHTVMVLQYSPLIPDDGIRDTPSRLFKSEMSRGGLRGIVQKDAASVVELQYSPRFRINGSSSRQNVLAKHHLKPNRRRDLDKSNWANVCPFLHLLFFFFSYTSCLFMHVFVEFFLCVWVDDSLANEWSTPSVLRAIVTQVQHGQTVLSDH